ncbi:hypothetical protein HYPSUDRAFT_238534 [Hypholoma sublateritium FD-334 SS-4]|uniref:Velvet domain-containing protein n=1 Tax=Hypholoma sublateritium (strain FD-334 SS-4) TaxID=945553 RepID=A0A0D2PG82_HYPSF|nr:hypothetical protein HYPSUDRAFT_238534 [Hypholoma sublateritium FD-334 SS-4]
MIQHIDHRQQQAPEVWGQWAGRRHYSLEVVQHPLRARMCGFGDKDRRPLAPAAVAKMIVRREDDSIVDVDEVDCSFFLVTVDLWSSDGMHEMNLVLHPSSADRYVPAQSSTKSKRRGTGRSSPTPGYRTGDQTGTSTPSLSAHAPYPPQPPPQSYFAPDYAPYGSAPPAPEWAYPPPGPAPPVDRSAGFPPPILPSIHAFGRPTTADGPAAGAASGWPPESAAPDQELPYRAWAPDAAYAPPDAHVDPALRSDPREWPAPPYAPDEQQQQQQQAAYQYAPPAIPYPPYAQPPPPGSPVPVLSAAAGPALPLPRHTYTRTLVGPLSANACRLLDEHRKPGIFFLFQDLSVRTEGSFRLRMRLMNVGAPPAPEVGAQRVHNDVSPVLAQTFTEQFTVYSAKRFPGVPDTTALSIAFGNQGQKLPLRNRHGSSKRRRRGDSSDEDSE